MVDVIIDQSLVRCEFLLLPKLHSRQAGSQYQEEFWEMLTRSLRLFSVLGFVSRGMSKFCKEETKVCEALTESIGENLKKKDSWRFVFISDTHHQHESLVIPDGDVLVHAGDYSYTGSLDENIAFRSFLERQPHPFKVFIAGNHDLTMHKDYYADCGFTRHKRYFQSGAMVTPEEHADRCIKILREGLAPQPGQTFQYLQDEAYALPNSTLRMYGSPWQPEFYDWAFNLPRMSEDLLEKWQQIPSHTDILITHGPPKHILDRSVMDNEECGCEHLLKEIKERIKPRIHVFGHLHEGYGVYDDGETLYINASTCTLQYDPTNPAIIIDVPVLDAAVLSTGSEEEIAEEKARRRPVVVNLEEVRSLQYQGLPESGTGNAFMPGTNNGKNFQKAKRRIVV